MYRTFPTPQDVSSLAVRIQRGDRAAEDELVSVFGRQVLALLRRRTRDPEAARELANDVLIAVVCALRAGRLADVTKLPAFVRGTTRNLANNYSRKQRMRPFEEPLSPDLVGLSPPDAVEERERLAALRESLARLKSRDREILIMTMVDGLKPCQIARDLGLPATVVRTRKSRALHRLVARTRPRGPAEG